QKGQCLPAFLLVELIDPFRISRVRVQDLLARDRMREEDRMNRRRTTTALLFGERRSPAALAASHVLPELVEVVRYGHACEPLLQIRWQIFVGSPHVGEFGGA